MKIIKQYFFVILFPIVLVVPMPLIYSSIGLALALANVLLVSQFHQRISLSGLTSLRKEKFILFGLFIVNIDWILKSFRDGELDFFFNEQRISFLIVPIIFYIGRSHLYRAKKYVIGAMFIGVMLYILYVYGFLIYFYLFETNRNFQLNSYLKYDITTYMPGGYHHAYIGMYMTFVIAIILDSFKSRTIALWMAGFLVINQFVLGSKLTFLLSAMLFFYGITRLSNSKLRGLWLGMVAFIATTLIVFFAYYQGLLETVGFSMQNRLSSWGCSIELVLWNSGMSGTNKGEALQFLEQCINTNAISTHNQILSELVYYGIFGLWILVYYYYLFKKSVNNYLFRVFIGLVIIVSIFENVFSLQRGIIFFTFFASLFMYSNSLKNKKVSL